MSEALYLEDCYMKDFMAKVMSVKDGKFVVLDQTAFYPDSGGQPHDTGILIRESDGKKFPVVYVGKFNGKISHQVEDAQELKEGDEVKAIIDWERRHRLMRMHTAAHVISRVLFKETGATTSGNQLGLDRSRIDYSLDCFDKEKLMECIDKANDIVRQGIDVKKSFMKNDVAKEIKGFGEPSPHLIQGFDTLRVVDIEGFDAQPCGGTHLDNTKEIGKIEFVKAENKGKKNRRLYYTVAD